MWKCIFLYNNPQQTIFLCNIWNIKGMETVFFQFFFFFSLITKIDKTINNKVIAFIYFSYFSEEQKIRMYIYE